MANPALSTSGESTGAITGFLNLLQYLSWSYRPKRVVVFWEGGGSSRRRAIFPGYKKGSRPQTLNRYYKNDLPDTTDNRDWQMKTLVGILKNVPVTQVYVANCEGDDQIAHAARAVFTNERLLVVSSDKDLYQLIDDRIHQWSPGQKKMITPKDVEKKFGVQSKNFALARAFVGDPSDAIPGIKGVGFTTLIKECPMIATSNTLVLDDLFSYVEATGRKTKAAAHICEGKETVRRNWKLMNLGVGSLSADQAQRVEHQCSGVHTIGNKMELLRMVIRAGIREFDADAFFANLMMVAR